MRDTAAFQSELRTGGLDVNVLDSSLRLPLVEAVRHHSLRAVLALLARGATARAPEPLYGITPLHLALQHNLTRIARALLAHGADPNVKDKSGVSARSLAISKEVSELVALYDSKGPLAFEPPPGSWLKGERNGSTYFWCPSRGETRWTPPPSCAWRRATLQGHPIKYTNALTGQTVTRTPPALAWAKVRVAASYGSGGGGALWLNWFTHVSSATPPAELPAELVSELEGRLGVRWYDPNTGRYSYEDPSYSTAWRELWDEATDRPFFLNVDTGETVWEPPEEVAWTRLYDKEVGISYYFNRRSGQVSWEAPASGPLSFVRAHDSDL